MDERGNVIGISFVDILINFERGIELTIVEQGLGEGAHGARITGFDVDGALIGLDGVLGTLKLVVGGAKRKFHFAGAVLHRDGFNDLGGMIEIAGFTVKTGKIQHDIFRVGIDGLRGLELFFSLLRLMLDVVELTENHAVFDIFGLERDDLFVLGDGLIEDVAAGRRRRDGILRFAELAEVEVSEQLVGVDIVGRSFEQGARGGFGFVHFAGAEVEICERVVQLGRAGVGIERSFVLLDRVGHIFGLAGVDGFFLVDVGKRSVIVGLGAVGIGGRRGIGWLRWGSGRRWVRFGGRGLCEAAGNGQKNQRSDRKRKRIRLE